MSTTPLPAFTSTPPRKRRVLRLRYLLLVFILVMAALILWPRSFRWIVKNVTCWAAERQGLSLSIGDVQGNLFRPVVFDTVQLDATSPNGVRTTLRVKSAEATFSLWRLLPTGSSNWLRNLKLQGVDGDVRVVSDTEQSTSDTAPKTVSSRSWLPYVAPVNVDAHDVNLRFVLSGDSLVINGADFTVSKLNSGQFKARQMVVDSEYVNREFLNVSGETAWQDQTLSLVNVKLAPGVVLTSINTDLRAFVHRQVQVDFAADAFGGDLRGELRDSSEGHLNYEANGSFSNIHLDALARFIGSPDPAGGLINEGKFTFRGSPRSPEKATMSVRFSSHDFRWGQRRCDSFVLGATLLHRRLLIPDLELKQAGNTLNLKGEMTLPGGNVAWWKSEFSFDVSAELNDLNQFSKLLGPRFDGLFGKLSLDGSVRGNNQQFNGQLIATGSRLSYRGAPLDALQAALKLDGNELQVINFELLHAEDYLRGTGTINILGNRQYNGELRASIADLTLYSALLQPPIAPQPLAGSLNVDWSGDGTTQAHSGAFHAAFKQLRPFGTEAAKNFHPLNADIEGTYSPGNIFLNQCTVSDADTQFSAKVTVAPESLHLQTINLKHGKQTWLQGDALVPINVWSAWPHPVVKADGKAALKIRASGLQLRQTLLLTGRDYPLDATIDFDANGEGALNSIDFVGQVKAHNLPLQVTPGLQITTDADFKLTGSYLAASLDGSATIRGTDFKGMLDLAELIGPIHSPLQFLPLTTEAPFGDWSLQISCDAKQSFSSASGAIFKPDLKITGTLAKPQFTGTLDFENVLAAMPSASLALKSGSLTFLAATPENPVLQAAGTGQANGHAFIAGINGTWQKPEFSFSMPDGRQITDFKAFLNGQEPAPAFDVNVNLAPAASPSPSAFPGASPTMSASPSPASSPTATPTATASPQAKP